MRITGVRPTGRMHIGHYFSVIKPALTIPHLRVLIAEYHAPQSERNAANKMLATMERYGVPMNQVVFQSEEFDADLYFQLLSIARVGELERMTQYMSAGDDNDAHLLVYPVLMVHDVFGYDEVIVGEDQAQHINYARDLIERHNRVFKGDVVLPVAKPLGGRIMSLSDPTKKMSKSEPEGCLFLDDSLHQIEQKVKKAVMTDEGRANLISLYYDLGGSEAIPLMNSEFKPMVVEQLVKVIHPVHAIQPVKEKIGESADNLQQRGAWFDRQHQS
jgi:tryptophanyl-tRNA synthetase